MPWMFHTGSLIKVCLPATLQTGLLPDQATSLGRQEKTLANRHILCLILRGTEADPAQQDVGSQGTATGHLPPAETKQKKMLYNGEK